MTKDMNVTHSMFGHTHATPSPNTHLLLEVVALLAGGGGIGISNLADLHAVVSLIPLTERGGIDLNNGVLNQCLGADQLVVRGVVDDVNNAHLLGAGWNHQRTTTGQETLERVEEKVEREKADGEQMDSGGRREE
jgi:hypothetical protein